MKTKKTKSSVRRPTRPCWSALNLVILGVIGIGGASACAGDFDAEGVEETAEELSFTPSCRGASCDGRNPYDAGCIWDAVDTGLGVGIFDQSRRQIGGIGIFRSPACQTVWASNAFYVQFGPFDHQICTARLGGTTSCFQYHGSYGNVGPMRFAPPGAGIFGSSSLLGNPAVSAVTPIFTAP